jgi:hypothetical protein
MVSNNTEVESESAPRTSVSRRKLLALTGTSLAAGLAGCPSDSEELGTETLESTAEPTATEVPDHTITATPGEASIGLSGGQVGTIETHALTLTIPDSLDGQTLTEVRVEYNDGFDLSRIDLADVTVTLGSEQGEATEIEISDVTVSDDATTITITLGGSVTLAAGEIVVAEYEGVELPSLAGEYLVTAILNGEASETGAITITESPGRVGSTFDKGIDGWRIEGDAQGGSAYPNYEETGGNPGGHISAVDDVQGGVWYFVAPANFRGDKSGFYGGTITFDLIQSRTDSQFSSDDIKLSGGGIDLVYDFGGTETHPRTDWTAYSATLDESDDWVVNDTGEQATAEEIQTVLADVTRLHIRGEYVSGSDTGYLDNPTLWPPGGDPPPADYDQTATPEE